MCYVSVRILLYETFVYRMHEIPSLSLDIDNLGVCGKIQKMISISKFDYDNLKFVTFINFMIKVLWEGRGLGYPIRR